MPQGPVLLAPEGPSGGEGEREPECGPLGEAHSTEHVCPDLWMWPYLETGPLRT